MINEVRIVRATAPGIYPLSRLRRWRWNVTYQRQAEGTHPGVHDRRIHINSRHGYTTTWLGAAIAAGRALRP